MADQIKAVDCLITIPRGLGKAAKDAVEAERQAGKGGLLTLFPGMAAREKDMTPEELVAEMDAAGVEKGMVSIDPDQADWIAGAMKKYPHRFFPGAPVNPIERGIMPEIRRVRSLIDKVGLQVIRMGGWRLGVPPTDPRLFPFYVLAIENNMAVNINVGYAGPPGMSKTQDPLYVDELCYLFPELKVIMTHGGTQQPYLEIVAHNMIKYPNCYLIVNAARPKYWPPEFIQHLNTRAQDKVMFATEFPLLTFKRSLDDIAELPLRDHVRPKLLRENALHLFKF